VTKNHQAVPEEGDGHDAVADVADGWRWQCIRASKIAHRVISMKAQLDPWIARLPALLRGLGPYAAIELLLPGGSVIALLIWLYRQRANGGART
jgi:hypothetical protein